MLPLTLYRKDGCWLCDNAEELLNGLRERHSLEVSLVDINSDDELYELYRFDIPVLEFPSGQTLHGLIKKKQLLQLVTEHQERGQINNKP